MSSRSLPNDERLLDLLAENACSGLTAQRQVELDGLLEREPTDVDVFDEAAAAIAVAFDADAQAEAMPAALRRSLSALAASYAAPSDGAQPPVESKLSITGAFDAPAETVAGSEEDRIPFAAWGGWLAAAAAVTFAVIISSPDREPTPREQLASLVSGASAELVQADWVGLSTLLGVLGVEGADHPLDTGVRGRVVMDDATDRGFMEIAGIEANDPSEYQYQLWIFDAERRTGDLPQFGVEGFDILTQRPVDGGVFDFRPGPDGVAVVPIDAKIPVGQAVIFAVTKEEPGGVVVSDRDIVFAAVVGRG